MVKREVEDGILKEQLIWSSLKVLEVVHGDKIDHKGLIKDSSNNRDIFKVKVENPDAAKESRSPAKSKKVHKRERPAHIYIELQIDRIIDTAKKYYSNGMSLGMLAASSGLHSKRIYSIDLTKKLPLLCTAYEFDERLREQVHRCGIQSLEELKELCENVIEKITKKRKR